VLAETLIDGDVGRLHVTICSAIEMLDDPSLRDALTAWDAQLVELDGATHRLMGDLFLGSGPPLLRPGRRDP
jgi:hypothetical protein